VSVAPPDAPTSRLITAGDSPPIVVMSDVGTGLSIVDALLGHDRMAEVTPSVVSWAQVIASVHLAIADVRNSFRAALEARPATGR
jgi:hypothetical protein